MRRRYEWCRRRENRGIVIAAVCILLLIAGYSAYLLARPTYPTSPEAVVKAFFEQVSYQNLDGMLKYTDPAQERILKANCEQSFMVKKFGFGFTRVLSYQPTETGADAEVAVTAPSQYVRNNQGIYNPPGTTAHVADIKLARTKSGWKIESFAIGSY